MENPVHEVHAEVLHVFMSAPATTVSTAPVQVDTAAMFTSPEAQHAVTGNNGALGKVCNTGCKLLAITKPAESAMEWIHEGHNLDLVRGTEVLHSVPVDEVYPVGPETVEVLEMMRSTPYFTAEVVVHLLAYLVEHDMELQEYLDEVYFAAAEEPMPGNQQNAAV